MDFPDCPTPVLLQMYLEELNETPIPAEELQSRGGRVPDYWEGRYEDWLKENAPVEFQRGFMEWRYDNLRELVKKFGKWR